MAINQTLSFKPYGSDLGIILTLIFVMLSLSFAFDAFDFSLLVNSSKGKILVNPYWWLAIPLAICALINTRGFVAVNRSQSVVIEFFGACKGGFSGEGLYWVPCWYTVKKIHSSPQTFETKKLRVNDCKGIPLEISACTIWQVSDPIKAIYVFQDIETYVATWLTTSICTVVAENPY
ncbi:MAG: SPFH domain-containing protein [Pseudomonadales bacterium]